jgi:hypothetical protein
LDSSQAARQGEPARLRVGQIKELRRDLRWYVKPEIPQIDKEIAEKGRFRTETRLVNEEVQRLRILTIASEKQRLQVGDDKLKIP